MMLLPLYDVASLLLMFEILQAPEHQT
jgi:hypothetical protein